jgi:peroxiredoxin
MQVIEIIARIDGLVVVSWRGISRAGGVDMRSAAMVLVLACLMAPVLAQEKTNEGPTNEKAQKTYKEALVYLDKGASQLALDDFKKADKQDGGHCLACQKQMVKCGIQVHDWKAAEAAAGNLITEAQRPQDIALAHYMLGAVLANEGKEKRKDDLFARAHEEMTKALAAEPQLSPAVLVDGEALACLKQDDAAKACFEHFAKMVPASNPGRQRALRYASRPELVRARMAPPFVVTTTDGQQVSLDDLQGKVVLLDFWATWCAECVTAVPHMRELARKFQGEPLVVISISLDTNREVWKDFIAKHEMTWPQYFDGGWTGPIAKLFEVHAIPHTFTIDADGVLQDERIGDVSIEGKLKKLVSQARDLQTAAKQGQ